MNRKIKRFEAKCALIIKFRSFGKFNRESASVCGGEATFRLFRSLLHFKIYFEALLNTMSEIHFLFERSGKTWAWNQVQIRYFSYTDQVLTRYTSGSELASGK